MLREGFYRSRQFFAAWGLMSDEDMADARRVLGPQLFKVFATMPRQYRLHSFNVYRRVRQTGCDDFIVWQAALLHDSGKFHPASGRYVTIVHRVIVVLLSATSPGRRLLKLLSRPARASAPVWSLEYWRFPFYLNLRHPDLGAKIAAEHSASSELVELIRTHHVYRKQSAELRILQVADGKS